MRNSVWNLNGVTLAGRTGPRLDDITLEIPGGVTAVMGESGAGKSSLLGLLTDFETPDSGNLLFHAPESSHRLPLFWSPQDHGLWPHLSVQQHLEYVYPPEPQSDRSIEQWLEVFGLELLKDSLPELLSQGERSRLALTRAMVSEAAVLVLDEPLVHVDPLMAHQCWQIVDEHIQQHNTATVFSTHDPDTVLKYAQHVICLQNGEVSFCGPVETLYHQPPTRELAWLLGPCNWIHHTASDGVLAVDALAGVDEVIQACDSDKHGICIRPTQLELIVDAESRLAVESIIRATTAIEVRLRDRQSDSRNIIFVSRLPEGIQSGDAVQLIAHPQQPLKPCGPDD